MRTHAYVRIGVREERFRHRDQGSGIPEVRCGGKCQIADALKASDKKDHLRVDVKGDVQGDTLKVTSVKFQ